MLASCFYQLLDYSNKYNWYKVQLVNNSARNRGDHIYGEFMNSDACLLHLKTVMTTKIVWVPLSYLVQTYLKFLIFIHHYHLSRPMPLVCVYVTGLAIGSFHCIHYPYNNNLALLLLFPPAGFLLVFFFIAFNLRA